MQGIADGSLPEAHFARWVIQDWRYLQTYVAVLERAGELAPQPAAATRWRDMAALSRDEELDLHRSFAARFGLSAADLESAEPWAATVAYTDFLLAAADRGYGTLVAALTPCGVDYVAIAGGLGSRPAPPDPRYAEWIRTYADPAFAEAVAFFEAELSSAEGDEAVLAAIYAAGAQHELAFWDALASGG